MPAKTFNAGAAQTINTTDDVAVKSVLLTAGSAAATLTITDNVGVQIKLAAAIGTSFEYFGMSGSNESSGEKLQKPVTIDVVGTGSFARVSY